jgi:hypothetical protein
MAQERAEAPAEAFVIEKWMEFLTQDDSKEKIRNLENALREQHSELLREMGEVHVRQIEAKNPEIHKDRQTLISEKLTCVEVFLLIADCMSRKLLFLSQMLNPATSDETLQAQLPYQRLLEQIIFVERQRLATKPRPLAFPWEQYPFKALAMICFPSPPA